MQLAAKIRKDFLKVDRFWRTFLTNHSKYNPIPLDQLTPIESPAPYRVNDNKSTSSYLKTDHNVPAHQRNDIGVQTSIAVENSNPTTNKGCDCDQEMNGTNNSIDEVKIESYTVYENVKCEFVDDTTNNYGDSNDYALDSDGDFGDEEDSKEPTVQSDVDNVNGNNETIMKRRSGRKYPKRRDILRTDPIKGEERLLKCLDSECRQGEKNCQIVGKEIHCNS